MGFRKEPARSGRHVLRVPETGEDPRDQSHTASGRAELLPQSAAAGRGADEHAEEGGRVPARPTCSLPEAHARKGRRVWPCKLTHTSVREVDEVREGGDTEEGRGRERSRSGGRDVEDGRERVHGGVRAAHSRVTLKLYPTAHTKCFRLAELQEDNQQLSAQRNTPKNSKIPLVA